MNDNNKSRGSRLVKNTAALYFRMILMIVIRLYTSRILLEYLGIDNYGIYSIVGGIVVLFSFLEPSLNGAIQRYFNTALGRGDKALLKSYFSTSFMTYLGFVAVLVLIAELSGRYIVMEFLNIPDHSRHEAYFAFHMFVISTSLTIMRSPYNALIIAHEEMSFYAYMSLIESTLLLMVIWLLPVLPMNPLEAYSALVAMVSGSCLLCYYFKCRYRWRDVIRVNVRDSGRHFKEISLFSFWGSFSSIANVGSRQSLTIIVNLFYGVGVNASIGIMNQVTSAIYGFVSNLQTAFNPQLIQSYASGDRPYLTGLTFVASKISYFLLFLLSVPVMFNIDFILQLWLKDVPPCAAGLCVMSIVALYFNTFGGVLWTLIQALGKIRSYQLVISIIILLNIPVYYVIGLAGSKVYILIFSNIAVNAAVTVIGLLKCVRGGLFTFGEYFRKVIYPSVTVTVGSIIVIYAADRLLSLTSVSPLWLSLIKIGVEIVILLCFISMLGLDKSERIYLGKLMARKFSFIRKFTD